MAYKSNQTKAGDARKRAAFRRGVLAMHGRKRQATDADLRSRNAYRIAAGLPIIQA